LRKEKKFKEYGLLFKLKEVRNVYLILAFRALKYLSFPNLQLSTQKVRRLYILRSDTKINQL